MLAGLPAFFMILLMVYAIVIIFQGKTADHADADSPTDDHTGSNEINGGF